MNHRIILSLAHMSGNEMQFIKEAFDTNWVAPLGPNVDAMEKDLEKYIGHERHVVMLCSGTSAIHLGLLQLGVGRDDEVICQDFTFSASANPIAYLGAKPVFVDSETETWNMSPELLEYAIKDRIKKTGRKPKAIIPVDLYGMPAKMPEIMAISNQYGIPVLEDSAEALGSDINGQLCGTFGEFGVFSFNGNKIITTSGGGALVCHTAEQALKTLYYATQSREPVPYYLHKEIGYNYRLSNVCAAIGRGQMTVLDQHIKRRREIHGIYTRQLEKIEGITVQQNPSSDYHSNFWLTNILIDEKKAGFNWQTLYHELANQQIETRPLWNPMHCQPIFKDCVFYGNGTSEYLFNSGLCLPSGSSLANTDVQRVIDCIANMGK